MAEDPVIRAEGLSVRFGTKTIFKDVSFEVRRGEIFVILGGSGCGKSTLLKALIGLVPLAAGHAWLLGEELAREDDNERRALLRRIGVMWQSGALFGSMTLAENVELPLEEHTDLPRPAREALALSKLGLVGLARALALDPPLLFLDEPGAGLDPITSAGLDKLIKDIARDTGATFVVVTHELQSILAIGDRCIMLDKDAQGMIAEGDPRQLKAESTQPTVRAFFRREAA